MKTGEITCQMSRCLDGGVDRSASDACLKIAVEHGRRLVSYTTWFDLMRGEWGSWMVTFKTELDDAHRAGL